MLAFPSAKINLGLHVLRKRTDGYHDIETVMYPVPLFDVLEVTVADDVPAGEVVLRRTGLPVPGDVQQDLCVQAAHLLGARAALPGLRMHLHKTIPIGAGLGGGSSDGASALRLIAEVVGLTLDQLSLHQLASTLGSDCPFFLSGSPQLATGKGEILEPIEIDLAGYWLLLVHPGQHVSTPDVYAHALPKPDPVPLVGSLLGSPVDAWQGKVDNQFEAHVLATYPAVADLKRRIMALGADYTSMSGSGSAVFGLFRQPPPQVNWPKGHRSWTLRL